MRNAAAGYLALEGLCVGTARRSESSDDGTLTSLNVRTLDEPNSNKCNLSLDAKATSSAWKSKFPSHRENAAIFWGCLFVL